ncbi:MAG: citrate lyase acyl carrier protein [Oscillibacter sp.]|nr:citrate lyase acyl carrier protein [Oscillibacter sp.]
MEIKHAAASGTLESSDIMVTVLPGTEGIRISLTSSVERYYGDSIRETMLQVLEEMDVKNADIEAVDHGALDCTIRARMVIAVRRACREEEPL